MSRSSRPRTLSGRAAHRGARDWLAGPACALALLSAIPAPAAVTVAPPPATAQPAPAAGSPLESAKALGKIVGRISAKDALTAPDISELAHETLTWGRRIRDAHLPVPPGPVYDALKGLDELEARGNKLADWSQLRKDLEELLERPPEPPPQKQQQQKDQQQNQSQQQQEQGGQKQDQPPQSQQQPQNQPSQDQSQEQQQQQQNQSSPADQKPPEPKSGQSAFGDMSKPPPPQPSPPSPGETQKVGGAPEKNPPQETDPSLTLPMEKLDQLKNQDSPAQLFQMMQADRSQASRKKPQKDW